MIPAAECACRKYVISSNLWHPFLFEYLVIIDSQFVWDEETQLGICIFVQVPLRESPSGLCARTHLLRCVGDNWWGEGWSQTHIFQPHSIAWGCRLFLWCDSALYKGCSHLNKWNMNAVVIKKQCLDTQTSAGSRFLLALLSTLSWGWQVYFNLCVRLDSLALGAVLRRTLKAASGPG